MAKSPSQSKDLSGLTQDQVGKGVVVAINNSIAALNDQYDNIEFKQVDVVVPDPWIEITQQNAWAGKGGQLFYMVHYDGSVQIRGFFLGGVLATVVGHIPLELCPPDDIHLNIYCNGAPNTAQLAIFANSGQIMPFTGTGTFFLYCRYMPINSYATPLSCFPINVKTEFKTPPRAVLALSNVRVAQDKERIARSPATPSWRFIQSPQGPVVQITNIEGLEYGCRQRVLVAIIGG